MCAHANSTFSPKLSWLRGLSVCSSALMGVWLANDSGSICSRWLSELPPADDVLRPRGGVGFPSRSACDIVAVVYPIRPPRVRDRWLPGDLIGEPFVDFLAIDSEDGRTGTEGLMLEGRPPLLRLSLLLLLRRRRLAERGARPTRSDCRLLSNHFLSRSRQRAHTQRETGG